MKKIKKKTTTLSICIVAFVATLIIDIILSPSIYIILPLYLSIYIFLGYNIFKKAFKSIFYGKILDENFLMTIATIGAFAIGEFSEGVAVLLFYQAGEIFQTITVQRSRKSVTKLMDIRPDFANVVQSDNTISNLNPEDVQVGDIIEIKPGEKIALDGIVISGSSNINTSMMSGESVPRFVNIGDSVISGCINIDGVIRVKVTETYSNSTVSKVLKLIEDASDKKSKSENFITKFAKVYTPIVCGLALILALLPPLLVGNWSDWIYRALCFLVVSCPCALVISVPLTFFAGIGCASKHDILIKGGTYLEKLPNINTFVFDKTGTLTKGTFSITDVIPHARRDEILELASIAEAKSTHPIAKAILDTNIDVNIKGYKYTNILGEGVIAKNKDNTILSGNSKLLTDNNIKIADNINTHNTIIYIAKNKQYIGAILVGDDIKPESSDIIAQLTHSGNDAIMLSGDNKNIAENVARTVGITKYYHDMLPNEKTEKIEELLASGKKVAFVGDGINDSPSLMRADIGISMGHLGSDSAIESSDIVIMNDNLKKIIVAKNIAKKTMRIVRQNIIFSLGIKIAILILSALGLSNMWWAIFGDVGVSVIAILNAIRAMHYNEKK